MKEDLYENVDVNGIMVDLSMKYGMDFDNLSRDKEAIAITIGIGSILAGLLMSPITWGVAGVALVSYLASDPDLREYVERWVDLVMKNADPSVFKYDKSQYVNMVMTAIAKGANKMALLYRQKQEGVQQQEVASAGKQSETGGTKNIQQKAVSTKKQPVTNKAQPNTGLI